MSLPRFLAIWIGVPLIAFIAMCSAIKVDAMDEWGAEHVPQPLRDEIAHFTTNVCDNAEWLGIVDQCAPFFWLRDYPRAADSPFGVEPEHEPTDYPVVFLTWHVWCVPGITPEQISSWQIVENDGSVILNEDELVLNLVALIKDRCHATPQPGDAL